MHTLVSAQADLEILNTLYITLDHQKFKLAGKDLIGHENTLKTITQNGGTEGLGHIQRNRF